jgi:Ser/Thr protein kinase RdoA (MazF antagonist)
LTDTVNNPMNFVLSRVARTALREWGIDDHASLRLLKHRENAVYSVECGNVPSYVLRVHRRGYHSLESLHSELMWMSSLNSQGIPTPQVIPTLQGQLVALVTDADGAPAYQCDLLSWVEGIPLGNIENRFFGDENFVAATYHQVGRLAAQVHLHSEHWQPTEHIARHKWDEEGFLGPEALWGDFRNSNLQDDATRQILVNAANMARHRLARYGKAPAQFGLIHADLVPENILYDGRTCTLIDFDDCGFGWYILDVAIAVFFQIGTPSFDPALRAFVRGYRQVRTLSSGDLKMLDVMLFLRSVSLLGWIKTRGDTETAIQIKPQVLKAALGLASRLIGDTANAIAL